MLAGAGDRLYGSVTPADIADEIWRARKIRVDRRKVQLDEPIRRLGTYQVDIEVFPEVVATVKTMVVPAEGSTFDLPVPRGLTRPSSASGCSRRKERDSGARRAPRRAAGTVKVRRRGGVGP